MSLKSEIEMRLEPLRVKWKQEPENRAFILKQVNLLNDIYGYPKVVLKTARFKQLDLKTVEEVLC